jgi:hypothetical protein
MITPGVKISLRERTPRALLLGFGALVFGLWSLAFGLWPLCKIVAEL